MSFIRYIKQAGRDVHGPQAVSSGTDVYNTQGAVTQPDSKQIFQGHPQQAADKDADDPGMGHHQDSLM